MPRTHLLVAALAALVAVPSVTAAQAAATPTPAAAPTRAADPADVASPTAIINAMYASISGPKGAPRDAERLRTLFAPNARMIYTAVNAEGRAMMRNWSIEEYITIASPGLMANGFYEREIGHTSQSFGNVTHVMSAYDSKFTLEDAKPFARGVNSIQLFNAGNRWYILTVMWDSERPGNEIPEKYLQTAKPE